MPVNLIQRLSVSELWNQRVRDPMPIFLYYHSCESSGLHILADPDLQPFLPDMLGYS